MPDREIIIYSGLLGLQPSKKQGEAAVVAIYKLGEDVQEGLHPRRFLAPTGLEDVEETSFPVHERLEGVKMPMEQSRAKVFGVWEESGNLLKSRIESLKATAPDLSKNLFIYTDYGFVESYLPEGRPGFAEGRGRGEYDALVTECNELKVANAELARRLSEAVRDQEMLRTALTASKNGQLRMTESYEGIVRHVGRDDVVVLFEVDDDLVEHTYTRDQFVDSRLPEKGDRLAVYVHVAQLPSEESAQGADKTTEGIDEQPRRRRSIGKGPREF